MYSLKRCQISHKIIRRRSKMGITNPDVYFAFTLDLQKSMSHPKLSILIAYQSCDMPVFKTGSGHVDMYICKDTTASRGSQEAASSDINIFRIPQLIHVTAHSDWCARQNHNLKFLLT